MLVLVLVSGCATEDKPSFEPSAFLGSSVAQLEDALPPDTTYVAYDVSLPVAGVAARYGEPGAGTNDDWLIVVACGSEEDFAVGVVNGEDYTDEIAKSAQEGDYDDLLVECQVG